MTPYVHAGRAVPRWVDPFVNIVMVFETDIYPENEEEGSGEDADDGYVYLLTARNVLFECFIEPTQKIAHTGVKSTRKSPH